MNPNFRSWRAATWLTPIDELTATLADAGFAITWLEDHTLARRDIARALTAAFTADADAIATQIGRPALDDLLG